MPSVTNISDRLLDALLDFTNSLDNSIIDSREFYNLLEDSSSSNSSRIKSNNDKILPEKYKLTIYPKYVSEYYIKKECLEDRLSKLNNITEKDKDMNDLNIDEWIKTGDILKDDSLIIDHFQKKSSMVT